MVPLREEMSIHLRLEGPSSATWIFLLAEFLIGIIITIFLNIFKVIKSILPKPPRDLKGETVVITGGTSSLGRYLASEFTRCGCKVICVDDDIEMVRKTACELRDKYSTIENVNVLNRKQGEYYAAYQCDFTERNVIREIAQKIKNDIGSIDILVTCVGNPGQDIFDTVSKTLMSHYWTVLAFLPAMIKEKRAHIVGITPTSSTQDAYLGTRAAISGLMKSLGEQFGTLGGQINFITVSPKADPRLIKQSEEKIAMDVVEAVRRNQCCAGHWSTLLYHVSCAIHKITQYFYVQGCDE